MLTLRRLSLSLLISVVVASIVLGLLLNKIYSQVNSDQEANRELSPSQLEALGAQLSGVLRNLDNKDDFIKAWQQENAPLFLEIMSREDVGMPDDMITKLETDGSIILSSSTTLSFYSYLAQDQYFVLRTPITIDNQSNRWLAVLFTFIFYALLILIVFIWLMPLVRQLRALQLSAKTLGEGDLSARITSSKFSYINDIEVEFNRMAQRIEELVSDIGLLSSAISHEMRAPLAKFQFGLDALEEEADDEKRQRYYRRLEKVIKEMTLLIDTLLTYARLDKNIAQLPVDEVDLVDLCKSLVAAASSQSEKEQQKIVISLNASQPNYRITGNFFYLNLMVENLISNAIKYGRGKMAIGLIQDDKNIYLCIEDNGLGIDENLKNNIFKPFVRGKQTQDKNEIESTNKKGYGLGMALVKRIADLHKVEIHITQSTELGGAKFFLLFPLPESSATN
jgi:two-component system, OmpR family, sensor kinase